MFILLFFRWRTAIQRRENYLKVKKARIKSFLFILSNVVAFLSNMNILHLSLSQFFEFAASLGFSAVSETQRNDENLGSHSCTQYSGSTQIFLWNTEFPELLGKANTSMVLSPAENKHIFFPVSHFLIAQFENVYQTHAIFFTLHSLWCYLYFRWTVWHTGNRNYYWHQLIQWWLEFYSVCLPLSKKVPPFLSRFQSFPVVPKLAWIQISHVLLYPLRGQV